MGEWRQIRLPMMFTVRRFDINWIKPLMTRSLWLLRTGHRGHRGPQGATRALYITGFFLYAGDWIARGARTRAWLERQQTVVSILNHIYLQTMNKWHFLDIKETLYIQCDTEKSRLEAKTEKAPSRLKIFSHHEQILLLLEIKLILNVINYQVKVHWSFLTTLSGHSIVSCLSLKSYSVWAHLVGSIERKKYGFQEHHPAGQHQVPEKRGKYWSTTIFRRTLPMIYLVWSRQHCIYFR